MRIRMIGLSFSIVLLLWSPINAWGENYVGISAYSMLHPKFPCTEFRSHIRKIAHPAVAILFGTFGADTTCLKKTLDDISDRPHVLEIHFSNESARRMHRPYSGELLPGYGVARLNLTLRLRPEEVRQPLLDRLDAINQLISEMTNGNTHVLLSFGLEDNYDKPAFKSLVKIISPLVPETITLVRNSIVPIERDSRYLSEIHRAKIQTPLNEPGTIVNPDGFPLDEKGYASLLRECSSCGIVYYWSEKLQGRGYPKFTPPRRRRFMFTSKDRTILNHLFK